MTDNKKYLPDPNCVKCGGTGEFDEWAETTSGNWHWVDTSCGCRDWR